jgi:hypothetical protein
MRRQADETQRRLLGGNEEPALQFEDARATA